MTWCCRAIPAVPRQPLDAASFTNGGGKQEQQYRSAAAMRAQQHPSSRPSSRRGSSGGAAVGGGVPASITDPAAAARGKEALVRVKQQMALFEELGNLRPVSRGA